MADHVTSGPFEYFSLPRRAAEVNICVKKKQLNLRHESLGWLGLGSTEVQAERCDLSGGFSECAMMLIEILWDRRSRDLTFVPK